MVSQAGMLSPLHGFEKFIDVAFLLLLLFCKCCEKEATSLSSTENHDTSFFETISNV